MLVLIFRTLILYGIVVISMRIMGKRQIGEMQPSELVVAIMISDLASVPMQTIDIPLLTGIIPVLTLIIVEIFMSFLSLKSRTLRRFITGEPSLVICRGHINEKELEKLRFNTNDLLEQLRISGYPDISEVETAILETNGQLSVIPKNHARPLTIGDLFDSPKKAPSIPCMLIADGVLNPAELARSQKTEAWLEKRLQAQGYSSYREVFIASLDTDGKLFLQRKGDDDQT